MRPITGHILNANFIKVQFFISIVDGIFSTDSLKWLNMMKYELLSAPKLEALYEHRYKNTVYMPLFYIYV